jgi:hypothetical protein
MPSVFFSDRDDDDDDELVLLQRLSKLVGLPA